MATIKKRKSIRACKNTPLDDRIISDVLEMAPLAPPWGNPQTLRSEGLSVR